MSSPISHRGVDKGCPRTWGWKKDKDLAVPYTEEQLKGVFKTFDTNQDGRLSRQELTSLFAYLGSHFPAWRAWRAIHHADANGDGYVSEEEVTELVNYVSKRNYSVKQTDRTRRT